MKPTKTKHAFKDTWGKLLHYCRNYWIIIVAALLASMIGTILTLIGPDKLSEMTDLITSGLATGIDMDGVRKIGFTLIAFYVTSTLLSLGQGVIMATITQKVSNRLRDDISTKINRLPISYFDRISKGDILSRVTNDVDTIAQSLNNSIGTLVSAITLLAGSLVMMLKTNVILTLTAIVATFIGFGLMMLIMGKSQQFFVRQQEDLGKINGHVEEIYSGHTIVKAYNGEAIEKKKFDDINNSLRESGFKAQSLSGLMMPIMSFIGNFGYVAVCIVGAMLAINGSISFGVIIAFIMYVRYFTQPLGQMAQAAQSLQSTSAASARVFSMLEATEMENESHKTKQLDQAEGFVAFKDVQFAYEGSDKPVINRFSAEAKPGQKIAIVG
ncbi:MAG TPA: ABC transporter ATP-binding protein, partial [Candidatus Jeotgalibaca merdavium]|nr:ABC transporter ATP-binding protein [Candidatus Jeotgalibaca merdavium]